ncbi:rhodanese-like domain-containing protein [Pseudoxanthomonas sp. Root630]|uniref:rhodanese-like domain-containing protein n=1 Tax=Pseudoxanthomonas sp. Root630 TaxID=1736574 RepID=UPI0009D74E26|nr:rhodanese-like domain-containing protein [Pseudoxanthomonas sp. Root630]
MAVTVEHLVASARSRISEISLETLIAWRVRVPALNVVDVREPDEFAHGHLPGAVNLPRGVLEFRIHAHMAAVCTTGTALTGSTAPLVLYCLSGGRSALAAASLQKLGFDSVRSLAAGFNAWCNAGLPVVEE